MTVEDYTRLGQMIARFNNLKDPTAQQAREAMGDLTDGDLYELLGEAEGVCFKIRELLYG